jgi:hypothetical protein
MSECQLALPQCCFTGFRICGSISAVAGDRERHDAADEWRATTHTTSLLQWGSVRATFQCAVHSALLADKQGRRGAYLSSGCTRGTADLRPALFLFLFFSAFFRTISQEHFATVAFPSSVGMRKYTSPFAVSECGCSICPFSASPPPLAPLRRRARAVACCVRPNIGLASWESSATLTAIQLRPLPVPYEVG